jgi:hypothetical protein
MISEHKHILVGQKYSNEEGILQIEQFLDQIRQNSGIDSEKLNPEDEQTW